MLRGVLVAVLAGMMSGCGNADFVFFESINSGPNPHTTLLVVWVSDSPADDAEALEVSFAGIDLLGAGTSTPLSPDTRAFDLLALQNGARRKLVEQEVDMGSYDRIRVTLNRDGGLAPRVRRGGVWEPLPFVSPTAHQVEVPYDLQVGAGQTVEIHIDFNARTSLVDVGGALQINPSLSALDPVIGGSITGTVRSASGGSIAGAVVVVRRAGLEVRSTRPQIDGSYELTPISPGVYEVTLEGVGGIPIPHTVVVVTGVPAGLDLFAP